MKFSSTEISDRIELLDYLRGFTLLGIMFVNINNMGTELPINNIYDQLYQQFLYLFIYRSPFCLYFCSFIWYRFLYLYYTCNFKRSEWISIIFSLDSNGIRAYE